MADNSILRMFWSPAVLATNTFVTIMSWFRKMHEKPALGGVDLGSSEPSVKTTTLECSWIGGSEHISRVLLTAKLALGKEMNWGIDLGVYMAFLPR